MHDTASCTDCGYQATSVRSASQRSLITVVDELGKSAVCDLCVIRLLARLGSTGDVTVFVARPAAVAS